MRFVRSSFAMSRSHCRVRTASRTRPVPEGSRVVGDRCGSGIACVPILPCRAQVLDRGTEAPALLLRDLVCKESVVQGPPIHPESCEGTLAGLARVRGEDARESYWRTYRGRSHRTSEWVGGWQRIWVGGSRAGQERALGFLATTKYCSLGLGPGRRKWSHQRTRSG